MDLLNRELLQDRVRPEWVDYNGHMNDGAYPQVFSAAAEVLIDRMGLDAANRNRYGYTVFTLETHVCFLAEAVENQPFQVVFQLMDRDEKRVHVFMEMKNAEGTVLATSEQMLMGMDTHQQRPAPFPEAVDQILSACEDEHRDLPRPPQAGRSIGIPRRSHKNKQ